MRYLSMFCLECGEKLPDNARFCFSCGTDLSIIQNEYIKSITEDVMSIKKSSNENLPDKDEIVPDKKEDLTSSNNNLSESNEQSTNGENIIDDILKKLGIKKLVGRTPEELANSLLSSIVSAVMAKANLSEKAIIGNPTIKIDDLKTLQAFNFYEISEENIFFFYDCSTLKLYNAGFAITDCGIAYRTSNDSKLNRISWDDFLDETIESNGNDLLFKNSYISLYCKDAEKLDRALNEIQYNLNCVLQSPNYQDSLLFKYTKFGQDIMAEEFYDNLSEDSYNNDWHIEKEIKSILEKEFNFHISDSHKPFDVVYDVLALGKNTIFNSTQIEWGISANVLQGKHVINNSYRHYRKITKNFQVPQNELIYLAYDSKNGETFENGFIVTNAGIRYCDKYGKKGYIDWYDFINESFSSKSYDTVVFRNHELEFECIMDTKKVLLFLNSLKANMGLYVEKYDKLRNELLRFQSSIKYGPLTQDVSQALCSQPLYLKNNDFHNHSTNNMFDLDSLSNSFDIRILVNELGINLEVVFEKNDLIEIAKLIIMDTLKQTCNDDGEYHLYTEISGYPLNKIIKSKKYSKALENFKMDPKEQVYLISDGTLFGKCTKGLAVTNRGIHIASNKEISHLSWNDLIDESFTSRNGNIVFEKHQLQSYSNDSEIIVPILNTLNSKISKCEKLIQLLKQQ